MPKDFDQALAPSKAIEDPQGEAGRGTKGAYVASVGLVLLARQSDTLGGFAVHGLYIYI